MNEVVTKILSDLSDVASKDELRHLARNLTDRDEALAYIDTLNCCAESAVRRASFVNQLLYEDANEAWTDYHKNYSTELPDYLQALLSVHNLDSPIVLDKIASFGDFTHLANLQAFQFARRGQSFVKNYKTFRAQENVSGKSNYFLKSSKSGTPKASTNNTLMIGDVLIRYPKDIQLLEVVAYAHPDEFWNVKKPAEAVMHKLYSVGPMMEELTQEYILELVTMYGAPLKEVANQVKWTLDGGYSKYGWIAYYSEETGRFKFQPYGEWDGDTVPDGGLTYSEFKKRKSK